MLRGVALAVSLLACGATAQPRPYADPRLLDMPWGGYSFVRPAWRGYVETIAAVDYLDGLGVVWGGAPAGVSESELAARIAAAGFSRVRLEIPWGSVAWDENGFVPADAERLARTLRALRAHGLRPLVLLNANHLQPGPVRWREVTVRRDAAAGAGTLAVSGDLADAERYTATVMTLADGVSPGPLVRPESLGDPSRLRLSKPLPRAVRAGERLRVALLKYAPLHRVGTPELEHTLGGWLRYTALTAAFVATHYGSDDFDVEIWNELTFGSAFLDAARYDSGLPQGPDLLQRGGQAWELARRTVELLAREHPRVRVISGFSNTTFFHVKVRDLPPGLHGQSYHPYGTARLCFAELRRGKESLLVDDAVPPGCSVQPEGYAHSWLQTESLVRLIAPSVRAERPAGSEVFRHYITEHGFRPADLGLEGAAARRAQRKFVLRAPLLWLGKGIHAFYVYDAFDGEYGMFDARAEPTIATAALARLTRRLAGALPIDAPRQLELAVENDPARAMPAPIAGAAQRDLVALVPMQIDAGRFAIAAYVMTQDFPRDLSPQSYFIDVTGFSSATTVTFYSPETDTLEPVRIMQNEQSALRIGVALTDVPRLIELQSTAR